MDEATRCAGRKFTLSAFHVVCLAVTSRLLMVIYLGLGRLGGELLALQRVRCMNAAQRMNYCTP